MSTANMFGRAGRVRIAECAFLIALAMALAAPAASAQAQFDGNYAGTATPTGCTGRTFANNPSTLQMTVAAGRLAIHSVQSNGRPGLNYTGTVDATGGVSASTRVTVDPARPQTSRYLTLSGRINGGNLTGTIDGRYCHWSVSLTRK